VKKPQISQLYLCCFLRTSVKGEYVNIVGGCMYVKHLQEKHLAAEVSC